MAKKKKYAKREYITSTEEERPKYVVQDMLYNIEKGWGLTSPNNYRKMIKDKKFKTESGALLLGGTTMKRYIFPNNKEIIRRAIARFNGEYISVPKIDIDDVVKRKKFVK